MTEISPELRNMTIPVGLSARAATIIAKALKQYEDLCPTSERELVGKLQAELKNAVSRVLNDRQPVRREPRPEPTFQPARRISPMPARHTTKPKSQAETMAEKMAEAGRAAVEKHKDER